MHPNNMQEQMLNTQKDNSKFKKKFKFKFITSNL